ncbi:MAG: class II fructose-bisphosphate aldolase [Clostridiales bacterium]|nr:class II fructose-bisphosphate aldolase [Clostridiales bacterium]
MLLTLRSILDIAEAKNIAIAAFNVTTLEGIEAVLSAAEELDQPVILQFANAAHGGYIALDVIGPIMVDMAERAKVPVCVHLDHGDNFAEIECALEMGFTSVMYDGSVLPYAENVANTRAVVELAEAYGASVEAEIGSMGREEYGSVGGGDEEAVESCYTDPDQAAAFVKATGVDALACSFGTVHGIYLKAPKLDIERIGVIREKTGVPVVMHGGSGISDEDFRKCIEQGVRKINFYTYAAKFAGDAVREKIAAAEGNVYFHDIAVWARESMKQTYIDTIRVFSNLK